MEVGERDRGVGAERGRVKVRTTNGRQVGREQVDRLASDAEQQRRSKGVKGGSVGQGEGRGW